MRILPWTPIWSLFAAQALAVVPLSSVKKETNLPIVPNRFIIEVDDVSAFAPGRKRTAHDALYASLRARDITFEVVKEFNTEGIFVGAAVILDNAEDAVQIMSTEGVKAIRPVRKFDRPQPVKTHVVSGIDDPEIPPDTQSTHILTGVDKLHAEGVTGKGTKIGIIDTGIDYTHPNLAEAFVGGFDLVGDDYNGDNEPVPDDDPLDQCAGHGTHVAGIIAASPQNEFNISGVAFESSISAYRVFGCVGSVTDEVLIDALLLGVSDGQDILTLSLGGADGWTETSSAVVASRIAESGKIVTIAAGNDGASGAWYSSSPGNGINVISVASLDNTEILLQTATVNGAEHDPIPYFELFPFPITEALPIFATSNDTTVVDDACEPLPDDTPDLSGFLVVVRRGTCTFVQKLTNIADKGATVAFIYDNGNGFNAIDVGNFNASLIQAADGEFLVGQFVAGVPITISFPQSGGSTTFPDPSGGLISLFSSYGPTNDFFFKPAVAAPGGNILSTLPVPLGSFGVESGTSMATPFVAGVSALLLSVKGTSADVATGARTLFESTAKTISSSHTDGDPLQTVAQQGAGLINAFDAIHATTILSKAELIINDTAHFEGRQSFDVTNIDSETKQYTLSHVSAGTALTIQADSIFAELGPVPLTADAASVTFVGGNTFELAPGESTTVEVNISPPEGLDESVFPVYSGFIHITSGTENLHVTYIGLAASLIDKQVVDDTDFFFGVPLPVILDSEGNPQIDATNYTFVGFDFPSLLWRLAFGTPAFRADLVDAEIELRTTLNARAPESTPFFTFPHAHEGGSFASVQILGQLLELDFISRNNEDDFAAYAVDFATPTFANGTTIPNGSYRILVRALRVTGDPANEDDFESWLSPIIGVTA